MIPTTTDVAIVGAGPVGVAAACALAGRGVDVTVLDAAATGSDTSRATLVHPRTLEVLTRIDVARRMIDEGLRCPDFSVRDHDRVLLPLSFAELDTSFRFTLAIPQDRTEAILTDRFAALGGVIQRPHRVTGLTQDDSGVDLTIDEGRTLRARFVLGADGMHSLVREAIGVGFGVDDAAGTSGFALGDVRIDGGLPQREACIYFGNTGVLVVVPLPNGAFRLVADVGEAPESPDAAYLQALLSERGPQARQVTIKEVLWGSRFRIHHRVADEFAVGRVLLAGDAGHVHSPAGGQGMNLGLRDALGAADAFVAALGGDARALQRYGAQRRPRALSVVRFTKRLTRLATINPRLRPARNLALGGVGHLPGVRGRMVHTLAGLNDR
ncbi:MAG TPA: NAD(P)/FAD-dependent oxidoreductase [Flexivirga sp.]|uniref:FAD-dependent oxidoreductase n=1 Tax=Flexivirga sp. TaxID=1962927 RepID=UPI002D0A7273|nr:NAD(P)/FAD-dependent oxidoreductase [Flexivirga sp.]HWC21366.1 NAD(P)/FAD-dependent oxidoreductase [Flexivirga sp.]